MSGVEEAALVAAIAEGAGTAAAGTAAAGTAAAAGGAAAAGTAGAAGAGLLGAEAAGAAGTGMLAADAGAAGAGLMGGEAAMATAPEAGAMMYTTPSVFPSAATAGEAAGSTGAVMGEAPVAEGMMPGAYSDVAGEAYAQANPAKGMMGYGKDIGKATSTYNAVNGAMGGAPQPQRPPPQGRPVFQGEAPQIAQGQMQPQENQFARMLLEQRRRAQGMLG